jgi:hypothetical protein
MEDSGFRIRERQLRLESKSGFSKELNRRMGPVVAAGFANPESRLLNPDPALYADGAPETGFVFDSWITGRRFVKGDGR